MDSSLTARRTYCDGRRIDGRQATPPDVETFAQHSKEMGMQQAHISALQHRHADIEARIEEESQRPLPDTATLARLKKEKLWIKEEIAGLH
jgi:hypothetical protein